MKLKRILSFLLCLILALGLVTPAFAAQTQTISVSPINVMVGGKVFLPTDVNGKDVPVFVYNGTTYAPLRALAEAYGLTVGYNSAKKLATVEGTPSGTFVDTKGTKQALSEPTTLTVSPINIEVNGEVFRPKDVNGNEVPVFVYAGTTYAPLRALAEAYGLKGFRVTNREEMEQAFTEALGAGCGCVIDCRLDMDEMVRPMVAGGAHITNFLLK